MRVLTDCLSRSAWSSSAANAAILIGRRRMRVAKRLGRQCHGSLPPHSTVPNMPRPGPAASALGPLWASSPVDSGKFRAKIGNDFGPALYAAVACPERSAANSVGLGGEGPGERACVNLRHGFPLPSRWHRRRRGRAKPGRRGGQGERHRVIHWGRFRIEARSRRYSGRGCRWPSLWLR